MLPFNSYYAILVCSLDPHNFLSVSTIYPICKLFWANYFKGKNVCQGERTHIIMDNINILPAFNSNLIPIGTMKTRFSYPLVTRVLISSLKQVCKGIYDSLENNFSDCFNIGLGFDLLMV